MTATLYLGTHEASWLALPDAPPLMVSWRRLRSRRTFPRAAGRWVLDSGGFTELATYGRWTCGPHEYATSVRRIIDEVGAPDWIAPQDWMAEPFMTERTGLTVAEHQVRTVDNFNRLRDIAGDLPVIPVLQGYTRDEYLRCADLYARNGTDLTAEPTVGIGSVCRRQGTTEAAVIVRELAGYGIALHGFGLKTLALARLAHVLKSADSLAWSYNARRNPPLPGCTHRKCANCYRWAKRWHRNASAPIAQGVLL